MHAFQVEMRHFDTTAVGICSPELRQARKALEGPWGLRSCAAPASMALPQVCAGEVLILGPGVPEGVNCVVFCSGF